MWRYSAAVADHFNTPRNGGEMTAPDAIGRASLDGRAPHVTIYLRAAERRIKQAMFQTFGCGYSIATCSALTEMITGQSINNCHGLTSADLIRALEGLPPQKEFCADMAIEAMRDALRQLGAPNQSAAN